ncbi:hypothetical protein [Nitratireductor basaltis]|uniref:Uncharacterized protein n=1 Tax=Nitratireductor basaltis TaxID=472175 RepID=A0A084UDL1_9HYPH|nr:hypothetical protein [Nitratireductor basaltis]KFB11047.1 hypothetical protein EL18_02089 [Nitratireductor basaltis]
MGLDILAYSAIEKIDCVFNEDGEPIDSETREPLDCDCYIQLYVNNSFPGRADEIENKGVYSFRDSVGFRAGSYGGYNNWRDDLAKIAGWPLGEYEQYGERRASHCIECWNGANGPFSELINFSDCEGVIGASVSQKLASDFKEYQTMADAHPDAYFREKYAEWRRAFELASDSGCVKFS